MEKRRNTQPNLEDDRILQHESTVDGTEEGGHSYRQKQQGAKAGGAKHTWPPSTALAQQCVEQWPEGNLEMGWHPTAAWLSDD